MKRLTSLLVKPTGPDCNIDCTYCFYLEKSQLYPQHNTHRMTLPLLEELIKQILQRGEHSVSLAWQGGEPTMMGLDFFAKAIEYQKKYANGKIIHHSFQTNGLLLDEQWAKFFVENNFLIGLSLDGAEHVHDTYRLTKKKTGTWKIVEERARMLLSSGVVVNALSCVNNYSVRFAEETYRSLTNLGFTFLQFIPIVETDKENPDRAASFSVSAEAYGEFLCKIFDLWIHDFKEGRPTISVRFFDSVFFNYVGMLSPDCTLRPECGDYVVVEHNGDVYSCDFFVEPSWRLGNIMSGSLVQMLTSTKQDKFGKEKLKLHLNCHSCRWLNYCHGGCPKDRFRDPRDEGLLHFCRSMKIFFEHADPRLKRLAQQWRQEQKAHFSITPQ